MQPRCSHKRTAALARTEVLVIVALAICLMGLLLLGLADPKAKVQRINCFSNLKAGECAFWLWTGDHNNRYPMELSTNDGGAREWMLEGKVAEVFRLMTNEFSTPKILFCPADNRVWATNWSQFDNRHLSYFIGVDAPCLFNTNFSKARMSLFLYGDRNLTNDSPPENGILQLAASQNTRWTAELHKDQGNICLANGLVETLNNAGLREAAQANERVMSRLAIP